MKKGTHIYHILAAAAILTGAMPLHAAVEDVTSYIINPNFSTNTAWNISSNAYSSTNRSNNCQEFYTTDLSNCWFNMNQVINNLPEGVYRFTINGFTRAGDRNISQTAIYATATDKEYMTPIILRHQDTSYGSMPNAMNSASAAFYSTAGNYWLNTIDNIIVEDGTLTIGARNTGQLQNGGDDGTWTIMGNAKLYRLTGSDLQPLMNEIITEAQTLADEGDFTGKSALSEAIATAESVNSDDLTLSDIRALKTAILRYRKARMTDASENNDIDATYLIANAGFENGAEFKTGTANGNYSEPKGWTLTYGNLDVNNNAGMASASIEQAGPNICITPTERNWAYSARMRWSSNSYVNLGQDITLPAGTYKLSADMANLCDASTCPTITLTSEKGNQVATLTGTATTLTTYNSNEFTIDYDQTVSLHINLSQNGQSNTAMAVDNLKLTYYGTGKIDEAEQVDGLIRELNKVLEVFVNQYNIRKDIPTSSWNNLIDCVKDAELVKDNTSSTPEDVQTAIDNLNRSMYRCGIDPETGDAKALIVNPKADDNLNGWTQTLTNIRNEESWRGTTDNYFDGGNWGASSGWQAYMKQELYLPAGYYSLSAIARCASQVNMTMSICDATLQIKANDNKGGNIWNYSSEGSAERGVNAGNGYGWNKYSIGFYVEEDTPCTLEVNAKTGNIYQWFSIDDFSLTYAAEKGSISTANNHISAQGAIEAAELTAAITPETRSIDLTAVTVLVGTPVWPEDMNPNCIIYAPLGMIDRSENIVCNGICQSLNLTDRKPFNAPVQFTAQTASYTRNAYRDGLYETIVLPFNAPKPEGLFSWEEIVEENNGYLKTDQTTDETLECGKAYLMRYTGAAEETGIDQLYQTTNATIEAYSAPEEKGLFGSTDFYTVESELDGIYMLSSTDGVFRLAEANSISAPFRACYKSTGDGTNINLNIFNDVTGISETEATPQKVSVYTVDGRLLKADVNVSEATIGLKPGVYIINHKKITIK